MVGKIFQIGLLAGLRENPPRAWTFPPSERRGRAEARSRTWAPRRAWTPPRGPQGRSTPHAGTPHGEVSTFRVVAFRK